MKVPLRVHIIPIGDDDLDRILKPPIDGKADRIYLISMEGKNLFESTLLSAEQEFIQLGKQTMKKYCDLADYQSLLIILGEIIKVERDLHNNIYVSISTGGNMAAAAGMTATMIFGGIPYFAKKDFTKNIVTDLVPIPKFHFSPPKRSIIQFLFQLDNLLKVNNQENISKHECLEIMIKIHPREPLSNTSGDYNKLKFRYLDALEENKYISIGEKPRGKIQITEEGKFALKIFQNFYDI
jgi:hypothetical protein